MVVDMLKIFLTKQGSAYRPEKCYVSSPDIITQVEKLDNFLGWVDIESEVQDIPYTILSEKRCLDVFTFQPVIQAVIRNENNQQEYTIDFLVEVCVDMDFKKMTKENFISRVLSAIK